jgi:hypothetical protein
MQKFVNNPAQVQNEQQISRSAYLREIMQQAWSLIKKNGFSLSNALKQAWALWRLKIKMRLGIVKFYYQKVDMTIREAYGTLCDNLVPEILGTDTRKKNDTVQTYYDTERESWRCFKKANLVTNSLI